MEEECGFYGMVMVDLIGRRRAGFFILIRHGGGRSMFGQNL